MDAEMNPLIPAGYDIAWSMVAALAIALTIVALISLARSARRLSMRQALVWTVLVLAVPVLGPIAWLGVGRRSTAAQHGGYPRLPRRPSAGRTLAERSAVSATRHALRHQQRGVEQPPRLPTRRSRQRADGEQNRVAVAVDDERLLAGDGVADECPVGEPDAACRVDNLDDFHRLSDRKTEGMRQDDRPTPRSDRRGRRDREAAPGLHAPAQHLRGRPAPHLLAGPENCGPLPTPESASVLAPHRVAGMSRVMEDTMSVVGGRLIDRLGKRRGLEVGLGLAVHSGGLRMRSGSLALRFAGMRLPLPRLATVHLDEHIHAADPARQHVDVRITAPLLGEIFRYVGDFTYEVRPSPAG